MKKIANRLDRLKVSGLVRLKVSVFNKIINIINLINYSYLIFSSLSSLKVIPSELLLMLRVTEAVTKELWQKISSVSFRIKEGISWDCIHSKNFGGKGLRECFAKGKFHKGNQESFLQVIQEKDFQRRVQRD